MTVFLIWFESYKQRIEVVFSGLGLYWEISIFWCGICWFGSIFEHVNQRKLKFCSSFATRSPNISCISSGFGVCTHLILGTHVFSPSIHHRTLSDSTRIQILWVVHAGIDGGSLLMRSHKENGAVNVKICEKVGKELQRGQTTGANCKFTLQYAEYLHSCMQMEITVWNIHFH